MVFCGIPQEHRHSRAYAFLRVLLALLAFHGISLVVDALAVRLGGGAAALIPSALILRLIPLGKYVGKSRYARSRASSLAVIKARASGTETTEG